MGPVAPDSTEVGERPDDDALRTFRRPPRTAPELETREKSRDRRDRRHWGGKSEVAKLLAARGASVIVADAVGHEVLADPEVRAGSSDRFGVECSGNGIVPGRTTCESTGRALGRIVFADPAARADLEAILHPLMRRRFEESIAELSEADPARSCASRCGDLAGSRLGRSLRPRRIRGCTSCGAVAPRQPGTGWSRTNTRRTRTVRSGRSSKAAACRFRHRQRCRVGSC